MHNLFRVPLKAEVRRLPFEDLKRRSFRASEPRLFRVFEGNKQRFELRPETDWVPLQLLEYFFLEELASGLPLEAAPCTVAV